MMENLDVRGFLAVLERRWVKHPVREHPLPSERERCPMPTLTLKQCLSQALQECRALL